MASNAPDNAGATLFLQSLLGKQLRITTTDTRIFVGQMRCTDRDQNVILAGTHEYRHPSPAAIRSASAKAAATVPEQSKFKLDMTSRYLGLVVVPGMHISKIELEEFRPLASTG
ncbi:hypothetical protein L228DRAFT_266447 [Xylona heveae TC161]|uniref:Sm domain-containing protein n=1 Tax=Xylona heveae (strain CBS 132557 / TC161) TaxID=1328760 RepID=A0A161TPG4_XYLHT|nr:hypothetical protein L228DRAFT_266447 [Xylona heveae TC161]KZF24086.1 hypothetical protein L228DRAFT_266447 [Xylona heveae TC161]